MIVVDTNIIAYFFIPGLHTACAEKALLKDNEWAAPFLWKSEFRNVVAGYLRQKRIGFATSLQIAGEAEKLLNKHEYIIPTEKIMELVEKSACSAYDCEYVALADELRIPLITTDQQILKSFPEIAISLEKFIK